MGQSYPDLGRVLLYHTGEPKVVGHENVDGSRCNIVESVQSFKKPGEGPLSEIRRLWIDPARGFVVPRRTVWLRK